MMEHRGLLCPADGDTFSADGGRSAEGFGDDGGEFGDRPSDFRGIGGCRQEREIPRRASCKSLTERGKKRK
jgi:hypothetical protein